MRTLRHCVLLRYNRLETAMRRCVHRLRDDSGSALVELSITLAILGVPLLMGTAHYSVLLINSMVVTNAAHAGAEYGMQSTHFADPANAAFIQTAAQDDAGMGTKLIVTPTVFYACSAAIGGTHYSDSTSANAACTGSSGIPLEFIKVIASADVTPATHVPWAPDTVTVSSTSIMVVQE